MDETARPHAPAQQFQPLGQAELTLGPGLTGLVGLSQLLQPEQQLFAAPGGRVTNGFGIQQDESADLVALGQADDVAGDEPGGVDLVDVAIAPHLDLLGQQPAQGLEGPFGAVGLPEREAAIDDDHPDDRHPQLGHALARLEVLGGEGQPGGEPQHEGEEMGELEQQGQPDGFAGQGFDPIRPEGLQAAPRFARAEPRSLTAEGGEGRLGGLAGNGGAVGAHD